MWYPFSKSVCIYSTPENQGILRIVISSEAEIILQFYCVLMIVYYIPLVLEVVTSVAT
jgi:hypothetical protein